MNTTKIAELIAIRDYCDRKVDEYLDAGIDLDPTDEDYKLNLEHYVQLNIAYLCKRIEIEDAIAEEFGIDHYSWQ